MSGMQFDDLHNFPNKKTLPRFRNTSASFVFIKPHTAGVATVCADDGKPFTLSGCEPIPCETPADMLDKYALSLGPKVLVSPGSPCVTDWVMVPCFLRERMVWIYVAALSLLKSCNDLWFPHWNSCFGEDFVCEPSQPENG